jgi:hypothetical protein
MSHESAMGEFNNRLARTTNFEDDAALPLQNELSVTLQAVLRMLDNNIEPGPYDA